MPVVEIDQLRVVYPNPDGDRVAINNLSLSIGHESVALLGPNGAGKSTLMGVLSGTVSPTSGRAVIHDSDHARGFGMVFQTPALDTLLTVRENLELTGALFSMPKAVLQELISSVCGTLNLTDRLDQQVRRLSGGLARRADIARALLPGPGVLLLDEPTSGLDVEARSMLWSSIESIRSQREMAVVTATHLTEEASKADRVILLADGELIVDGQPNALLEKLGSHIIRVRLHDESQQAALHSWATSAGCEIRSRDTEALIAHASPDLASQCPIKIESLTLAAPTLEDVYLWHARSAISEGAPS